MMQGEQLYYSSGNFAFRIDDEGRVIDNINGQVIGICNQKKKEILRDYDIISKENLELKGELERIKRLIEQHKDVVPGELRKVIDKPPTVEELQDKISNMEGMMAKMMEMMQGGGGDNDVYRGGNMPKTGTKQSSSSRSGKNVQPVESESE